MLFMLVKNLPLLLVARVCQGLSGGAVNVLGYTLTFDTAGRDQIGVAIGYVTMSLSLGIFCGPIVGGPLYDFAGYVWVFMPMVILIGFEIIMRLALIEPVPRNRRGGHPEDRHQPSVTEEDSEIIGERSSLLEAEAHSHRSSADASIKNFPRATLKSPLSVLFGNRRFVVAIIATFIGNTFIGALDATLPVFAYEQLGFTSTQTALLLVCPTWPQFLGPLAGWVVDRAGPKWPTAVSFVISGLSLGLMYLTQYDSDARVIILVVLLTVYGCSITLMWGPIVTELILAVEDLEKETPGIFGEHGALALGLGLQTAAFGAGSMIGPIYAGVIFAKAGWGLMSLVLGVISFLTAVPVALYTGGDISRSFGKPKSAIVGSDYD